MFPATFRRCTRTSYVSCHLQALYEDLTHRETEIDEMTDKAQALSHVSADTRVVSSASQCANKHQTLAINFKVTLHRCHCCITEFLLLSVSVL